MNRLVYSMVLIPFKDNDINSPYYDKYYFLSFDDEVQTYIERILSFSKDKNYSFEVRNKSLNFTITDFDNLISNFSEYKEDLYPCLDRMNKIIKKSGDDPEIFLKNKIVKIASKRMK